VLQPLRQHHLIEHSLCFVFANETNGREWGVLLRREKRGLVPMAAEGDFLRGLTLSAEGATYMPGPGDAVSVLD
jgi:hypothetical protein